MVVGFIGGRKGLGLFNGIVFGFFLRFFFDGGAVWVYGYSVGFFVIGNGSYSIFLVRGIFVVVFNVYSIVEFFYYFIDFFIIVF